MRFYRALAAAWSLALLLTFAGHAHATAPATSPAWVNVVSACGADPTDTADSTADIQTCIGQAITGHYPLYIPAGKYKVSSELTIDYAGNAGTGFLLIADGATLDGSSIASGPVLQVECSGGTPSSPTGCFYFHQQGTLFISADSGSTNLTTLSAAAAANATVLSVTSTAPFTVGQTVDILLSDASTQADPVTAIGSGTITVQTGLRHAASSGAAISLPSYAFVVAKADMSDAQNSVKLDHVVVNNASTSPGAGACQFNYVLDSDLYVVCDSAGGAAGIALEQLTFSRLSGAGSANGTGGVGLVLENGYDFANTISGIDLEVAPTCLSITTIHDGTNTFISPYLGCNTAISAVASNANMMVNPTYAGNVVNVAPQSVGLRIIGGNVEQWAFPTASTFVATAADDGTSVSSYDATGSSLAVTLPDCATVNAKAGFSMGFATDNGKGMTITTPAGGILSGQLSIPTLTMGAGNYEYVRLECDGNNYRVTSATRATRLNNGFEPPPWPSNWLYPSTSGYAAQLGDDGNTLSSFNTSAGLTVTLPSNTNLPIGWSMGFATDSGKPLTVQVNGTSGGKILYPGSGALTTSITMASGFPGQNAYEYMVLQYDGSQNFRLVSATPATMAALDALGTGGRITRWSFPSGSTAYAATAADNGNMISSYNSSSSFLAVTLPSTTTINQGWTIGISQDDGKTMSVQVNGTSGGAILVPGTLGSSTSFSLAGNYENAILQYDGANFRVIHMTPLTMNTLGGVIASGTPASASAPCQTSEIETDSNNIYVCTAPNTWKAIALGAFP